MVKKEVVKLCTVGWVVSPHLANILFSRGQLDKTQHASKFLSSSFGSVCGGKMAGDLHKISSKMSKCTCKKIDHVQRQNDVDTDIRIEHKISCLGFKHSSVILGNSYKNHSYIDFFHNFKVKTRGWTDAKSIQEWNH